MLERVARVELVELGTRLPDAITDEGASGALREPLDEGHVGDPVDDVVKRVVGLHPLGEQPFVSLSPSRA